MTRKQHKRIKAGKTHNHLEIFNFISILRIIAETITQFHHCFSMNVLSGPLGGIFHIGIIHHQTTAQQEVPSAAVHQKVVLCLQ